MTAENLRIGNVLVVDSEYDGSFKVHVVGTDPIISSDRVTFKPILKKNRTGELFVSTQNVTISIEDGELAVYDVIPTLGGLEVTDYSDELPLDEWETVSDLLSKAEPKMRWALDNLVDDAEVSVEDLDESEDDSDISSETAIPSLVTSRYYVTVTHLPDLNPADAITQVFEDMPCTVQNLIN